MSRNRISFAEAAKREIERQAERGGGLSKEERRRYEYDRTVADIIQRHVAPVKGMIDKLRVGNEKAYETEIKSEAFDEERNPVPEVILSIEGGNGWGCDVGFNKSGMHWTHVNDVWMNDTHAQGKKALPALLHWLETAFDDDDGESAGPRPRFTFKMGG